MLRIPKLIQLHYKMLPFQGSHTGQLIIGREAMHSSSFITSTKLIVMYGLIIRSKEIEGLWK
ncbi:hypothetical protein IHE45_01G037800 [Dioscorea alata]|uniref:Uncharacterized protein n=1 Tax=Dioscorea alata TaxID=55571 RepID=A0ACB7WTU7_DIOAL|nr:hypothetical protein IHE45_01G037800 [Dioscorea alata]